MRVFISSLITGMETIRAAAREAVTTLRHEPIMAEEFGPRPHSPQVACLAELRQADIVVLILGEHYGSEQPAGLSATHEEYREAKGRKPVIAFVQEQVLLDPQQRDFVREVQGWEEGLFRGGFSEAADLKVALTRALHDYELAIAVGPVDQNELIQRALAQLGPTQNSRYSSGRATVNVSVAGGPRQSVLRPIEIEKPALADALHQAALFGPNRLFDSSLGVRREIEAEALVLEQERGQSRISLNEQGSILLTLPVSETGRMLPELIYEFVQKQISDALAYASWVLDHIDPTQRLTHVAVAASISNAEHTGWRTLRESEANPNQMSISMMSNVTRAPVHVTRARAALRLDTIHIVEDLIVPLRRQWR
jgi:hypothetical protein